MIYLRHTYLLGDLPYDHVGPFESSSAAMAHRDDFGPQDADIIPFDEPPVPCMSPEEHITYLQSRY